MKVKTILVLVETVDGHVHQVLAEREQKEIVLQLLRSDSGTLRLSERIEPITLEKYSYPPLRIVNPN